MRYARHAQRGFTLIELMIAVVVISVLAAIAFPAYTKSVQRGFRSEGIAMLSDAVARTERYYAQNNSYLSVSLTNLGITNANSTNSKYTLSFSGTPTATTYTLQVVPINSQTTDSCGTLTIAQDGTRTPDPSTTSCWK